MNKYGLIGSNVEYSMSKLIHEKLYKLFNMDLQYDLISTSEENLFDLINMLRNNKYLGFNVTIPYKTTILQYVDVVSKSVEEIGACNTVYCKDGLIYADNTDVCGFEYLLDYFKIDLNDTFILGTGGSSKSVEYVLKNRNINYNVIGRTSKLDYNFINNNMLNNAIINTTPIGMYPNVNNSVITKDVACKASVIIDLIYNPDITLLMSYNTNSFNGLVMLVYQAIKSFEIWTNKIVSKEVVQEILKEIR